MKKTKSELPHYYVKNGKYKPLFLLWDEAYEYCEVNNLSVNLIIKSYYYE
jgi:hypothetical protein